MNLNLGCVVAEPGIVARTQLRMANNQRPQQGLEPKLEENQPRKSAPSAVDLAIQVQQAGGPGVHGQPIGYMRG